MNGNGSIKNIQQNVNLALHDGKMKVLVNAKIDAVAINPNERAKFRSPKNYMI